MKPANETSCATKLLRVKLILGQPDEHAHAVNEAHAEKREQDRDDATVQGDSLQ